MNFKVEETIQMGSQALDDLGHQREAILGARERLRETDHVLGKSSNVLTRMLIRAHSQKAILICLFIIGVLTVLVTFFLVLSKRWGGGDSSGQHYEEIHETTTIGAVSTSTTFHSIATTKNGATDDAIRRITRSTLSLFDAAEENNLKRASIIGQP